MDVAGIKRVLDMVDTDHANAPADAAKQVADAHALLDALVQENNALRRNNERLLATNKRLTDSLAEKRSAVSTAQTMAEHWRLKAQGGDYDATKEEM